MAHEDEPPRRPRRKTLTPVTGSLVAVILAAGGFAGGVTLQKNRGAATVSPARTGFPTGGPPGLGQQASSDATSGTVSYAKGDVFYVKDGEGNTVKVQVKSSADVTRTASSDSDKIQPGDSVVVEGAANSKGTVTATAVTATQAAN
jgi:hypothetical protein